MESAPRSWAEAREQLLQELHAQAQGRTSPPAGPSPAPATSGGGTAKPTADPGGTPPRRSQAGAAGTGEPPDGPNASPGRSRRRSVKNAAVGLPYLQPLPSAGTAAAAAPPPTTASIPAAAAAQLNQYLQDLPPTTDAAAATTAAAIGSGSAPAAASDDAAARPHRLSVGHLVHGPPPYAQHSSQPHSQLRHSRSGVGAGAGAGASAADGGYGLGLGGEGPLERLAEGAELGEPGQGPAPRARRVSRADGRKVRA